MYTIELTEGRGWDAVTLRARAIKMTVDLAKVEALAADWLHEVQLKGIRCRKARRMAGR